MYLKSFLLVTLLIVASSQSRHLRVNFGGRNSSSYFTREFAIEQTQFCKTGGEKSTEKLLVALEDAMTCISQVFDASEILNQQQKSEIFSQTPSNIIWDYYCSKLSNIKLCVHPFMDAAVSCTTSNGRNATSLERKELNAIIEFTCRKDKNEYKIQQLFSNGRDCIFEKSTQLEKCLQDTDTDISTELSDQEKEEECAEIKTLEQCVLPVLKSCKDPEAGQYFEEFSQEMKRVVSCQSIKLDIDNKITETAAKN